MPLIIIIRSSTVRLLLIVHNQTSPQHCLPECSKNHLVPLLPRAVLAKPFPSPFTLLYFHQYPSDICLSSWNFHLLSSTIAAFHNLSLPSFPSILPSAFVQIGDLLSSSPLPVFDFVFSSSPSSSLPPLLHASPPLLPSACSLLPPLRHLVHPLYPLPTPYWNS